VTVAAISRHSLVLIGCFICVYLKFVFDTIQIGRKNVLTEFLSVLLQSAVLQKKQINKSWQLYTGKEEVVQADSLRPDSPL
jgi:hypothetical protein